MKSLIVPLAALGVMVAATGAALAAPPAYCALYAREYANQFALAAGEKPDSEPKIQDEAYYRCLNMDQEPQLPTTSAYYGTSVDTAGKGTTQKSATASPAPTGSGAPVPTATNPPAPAGANTANTATASVPPAAAGTTTPPTPAAPPKPMTKTADSAPPAHSYTGGKTPWTPEWFAACRKYFPNSFNDKDGTVLPHGANKRVFCR